MLNLIETLEACLKWLGAIAGLGTLAYSIYRMLMAQRQLTGYHTGAAKQVLRTPYLMIASVLFIFLGYILWKPLPIQLSWQMRLLCMLTGGIIFFASLIQYVWGLRTLGLNFNASSGFGVRLHQAHQLVTHGPYAYIRHPMYLGVIMACWSGLLIYRSWTMLVFAVIMLGLVYRAHKEEEALAQVFADEWTQYTKRVPGWFPSLNKLK